jgi:DNA-binding CsgD family transcriptional regulator
MKQETSSDSVVQLLVLVPADKAEVIESELRQRGWSVEPAGRDVKSPPLPDMTPREREILDLRVQGLRVTAMASRLFLAPNTVLSYLKELHAKFGVHSHVELIAEARRRGFGSREREAGARNP